jgi:signal transduction histidine kinase/CheY-like chemotaxis protein
VSDRIEPQLGALIVTPMATIGVLAAVLMWEIEHVGSVSLAVVLFASAAGVAVLLARIVRRRIRTLAEHYKALLQTADEESRRAEAANRGKDDFLATLSHELRTPLNSVLGWARLLAGGQLSPEMTARAVQAIERAGWSQSRVIEDLLDISQIVGGRLQLMMQPTSVERVVDAAVQALQSAADGKQITIETAVEPGLAPIYSDPDRVQQIVWNLLSNAIKFTPQGGTVRVNARVEHRELRLDVIDTGIGFDAALGAHLFERFRQGDSSSTRAFRGLGLGLAIVRHLTELHGGTVSAESKGVGRGATFHVQLPIRSVAPSEEKSLAPEDTQPMMLSGVSVLVVDDDREMRSFVQGALERYGATVSVATSLEQARDRLNDHPPDVLVSDLGVSEEAGIDLIREVRQVDAEHGRHTPAAVLSALARSDDRRRTLAAGYEMHVTKPVEALELASLVSHLARRSG